MSAGVNVNVNLVCCGAALCPRVAICTVKRAVRGTKITTVTSVSVYRQEGVTIGTH